jgi:hypothetical protein
MAGARAVSLPVLAILLLPPGVSAAQAQSVPPGKPFLYVDRAGMWWTGVAGTSMVTYGAPIWEAVLQTNKTTYVTGEPVGITFSLTNRTSNPVTLHFGQSCQASFRVLNAGGTKIYEQPLLCFPVFTERTWQPNQTVTYGFTWTQVNDSGQQVPVPGDYQIQGFMLSEEEVPEPIGLISIQP